MEEYMLARQFPDHRITGSPTIELTHHPHPRLRITGSFGMKPRLLTQRRRKLARQLMAQIVVCGLCMYLFQLPLVIGTAYTSNQNGQWAAPAIWTPTGVPGSGDTAAIDHTVAAVTATACGDITISASGTLGLGGIVAVTLTIDGGSTISNSGSIVINSSSAAVSIVSSNTTSWILTGTEPTWDDISLEYGDIQFSVTTGANTLTFNENMETDDFTISTGGSLVVVSGKEWTMGGTALSLIGNFYKNTSRVILSSTSTVTISGAWDFYNITMSTGTYNFDSSGTPFQFSGLFVMGIGSTFGYTYNGAVQTTVLNTLYQNLTVGPGTNFVSTGNITCVNFTLTGTFAPGGNLTASGTSISNSGTFTKGTHLVSLTSTSTVTVDGTWDFYDLTLSSGTYNWTGSGTPLAVSNTFTKSTSTVGYTYTGAVATTIAALTYNDLSIGSGTNFSSSGAIVCVNFSLTGTFSPGADVTISGTWSASGATYSATAGTTTLSGTCTVDGTLTFANLTCSGTVTSGAAATVTTVLNISGGLDTASYTYTLSGTGTPLVISGTFTPNTGKIKYTGAGATNITAATYYDLEIDASGQTHTAAGDITASNVLTITAGEFDASSRTITLSGTGTPFVISGTFTASTSTVKYTGAGATNIASTTYYDLEIDASGQTHTAAGDITCDNNCDITAGTLVKDDVLLDVTATLTITGTLQDQNTAYSSAYQIRNATISITGTYSHDNAWLLSCDVDTGGDVLELTRALIENCNTTWMRIQSDLMGWPNIMAHEIGTV